MDLEQIKTLIRHSTFLDETDKSDFLSLVPHMSEEEVNELIDFLQKGEQQLEVVHKKYDEEKQKVLKNYSSKITQDASTAKKQLAELIEKKSLKSDVEKEKELLEELEDIDPKKQT